MAPELSHSEQSEYAKREAALDRINDDPAWAQRAYGAPRTEQSPRPRHADIWERVQAPPHYAPGAPEGCVGQRFTVMHVCGHHDPPHVTGYWWPVGGTSLDAHRHGSIPLPRFRETFTLVEREC